ncbi:prepilin-type N-terminal cleavage/methylation domain-containing protein [Candidatus Peregrinibacteria bacterium]|nr:prepilin-type N-terminal cleavage/methylation domain-containing protein [Candidatus Peregrinibacteria bacterium]
MVKKRSGMTLVELILVVIIVTVLMAAGIGSILRSQRAFTFNAADQAVSSMVRTARSYAITGRAVQDYTDYNGVNGTTDQVTPANYGIYFDTAKNQVFLFADIRENGNEGIFQPPASGALGVYKADKDVILEAYEVDDSLNLLVGGMVKGLNTANTILYSPIFSDTTFSYYDASTAVIVEPSTTSFFVYGIREADRTPARESCFGIQPVAGVPESLDNINVSGVDCPT